MRSYVSTFYHVPFVSVRSGSVLSKGTIQKISNHWSDDLIDILFILWQMAQEVIYIKRLHKNLNCSQSARTPIYEDIRLCIAWSEGSIGGSCKAKPVDLRQHFVHEAVEKKALILFQSSGNHYFANLLTKPLGCQAVLNLQTKILGL